MLLKWSLLAIVVFCLISSGFSQPSGSVKARINKHYEQASNYKQVSLYGESMVELDFVIQLAKKYNSPKDVIKASIEKAELLRKTENFKRGIDLIYSLKNTKKYPELHVQKLGRLAALYAEDASFSDQVRRDSINAFVKEGIEISTRLKLRKEEAGLRNELGFAQSREKKYDSALKNLNRAQKLYRSINDLENEMGVRVNILDLYVGQHDFKKCDSMYPILVKEIASTEWYSAQSKLYGIIAIRYKADGEIVKELDWGGRAKEAASAQVRLNNSNQMASFKVIHDTNKFKEEAYRKSVALEQQQLQTQRLLFFMSLLSLAFLIVIIVIIRERRLKKKLDVTNGELNVMNDKYEMLIVESNHRIKNNLQMIISMLEFTRKGIEFSDTDIIKSMSGKIQTISALHKHLYVDIHNEHVDLGTYFDEILGHYEDIGLKYTIHSSICPVQIQSERIVYFGLILNEMLSNTMEHGRSDVMRVSLNVEAVDGGFMFQYSDGSGHPENCKEGTGTKLIKQLVVRIKGTNYTMHSENGTYSFHFEADSHGN